jgi:nitrite reductase (NO-forming)
MFSLMIGGCSSSDGDDDKPTQSEPPVTSPVDLRVNQMLVAPPLLPVHEQVAIGEPKVVWVRLVAEEKVIEIAPDGTKIWALTFNGSVPGPMIVVHQCDFVELTLVNPATNTLQHNIDLHAASGELGGAGLTLVNPGQEVVFRFQAIKAGVIVYHCALGGVMIPSHVISGMNGAITVLSREGPKDAEGGRVTYDEAYYIGEAGLLQTLGMRTVTTRSTRVRLWA